MARYILTGTPGAGKTALLRLLERRGYAVVEEAATDVIALMDAQGVPEHWLAPDFIDLIVALQKQRQLVAAADSFFDRSPICTWALAEFLGREPSARLKAEIERIEDERTYERQVFFVQNLGFVTPTAARKISYEDALRFEQVHLEAYRRFGYEIVLIPPGDLAARADQVLANTPFQ